MPGPEYERFIESMHIGFEQWHDGTGYDLSALAAMTIEERGDVEAILISHLSGNDGDWRDVEALSAMATPNASAAVKGAAKHRNLEVRNYALGLLAKAEPLSAGEMEDEIVRAVERGALDLAQSHPTPRIKRAVLDCARLANAPATRVNAAALLMYLCGKAEEPFDWNQRPFFLRFATMDNQELRAAWVELRERTGI
jgi:hypothetical protein